MTVVSVLPSIVPEWTYDCVASMCDELRSGLIVVDNAPADAPAPVNASTGVEVQDNAGENWGVARSWNVGVERALTSGANWLIVMSASTRFWTGPEPRRGGMEFLSALDDNHDAYIVEAGRGIGWHLIAFSRTALERVGPFDPIFFAYMEDIDWAYRFWRTFGGLADPLWRKVEVDVSMRGFAHGVELGHGAVDNAQNIWNYREKWGGDKGHEVYEHPYNDETLDLTYVGAYPGHTGILNAGEEVE